MTWKQTKYCKTCKRTRYYKFVHSKACNWIFWVCNKCQTTIGCW